MSQFKILHTQLVFNNLNKIKKLESISEHLKLTKKLDLYIFI